ncbi:MAG TPA: LTA synthase family protein [Symbiobacteriaceae bacterium]|nr:LTA synthase family protein [Symbiobacteriaceae bacterium]
MRFVLVEYAVALVLMLLQVLLFHQLTGEETTWLPVTLISLLLLVVLTAPALVDAARWRRTYLLTLMLLLTGILCGDLLFFRFFGRVVPLPALTGFKQVAGVTGSIRESLQRKDLLLLVAPTLLFLSWYFASKNKAPATLAAPQAPRSLGQPRSFSAKAGVAVLTCLAGLGGTAGLARGFELFNRTALQQLYNDNRVLDTGGAVAYHLADVMRQFRSTVSANLLVQATTIPRPAEANLHGIAKGKNLIIIQLESAESFPIGRSLDGQVVTPNLNAFQREAIWFPDFWAQVAGGNTSDAEFAALNSLHGLTAGAVYVRKADNTFHSLAHALAEAGYQTDAFHAYKPTFYNRGVIYPQQGFQGAHLGSAFFQPGLSFNIGLADHLFFKDIIRYLKGAPQPFFAMAVTLSGHHPYEVPPHLRSLQVSSTEYDWLSRSYLEGQHYVDRALGQFFSDLKQAGLWDNTVIAIYGDHPAVGVTEASIRKFTGTKSPLDGPYGIEFHKVPLLIRLPGGAAAGPRAVAGGQIDIFPTLVNLMGLSHEGNFYLGQDLLNPTDDGLVALRYFYPTGSFASKRYVYEAAPGGQLSQGKCLDRAARLLVDPSHCASGYQQALWELSISDQIVESNALPSLLQRRTNP